VTCANFLLDAADTFTDERNRLQLLKSRHIAQFIPLDSWPRQAENSLKLGCARLRTSRSTVSRRPRLSHQKRKGLFYARQTVGLRVDAFAVGSR